MMAIIENLKTSIDIFGALAYANSNISKIKDTSPENNIHKTHVTQMCQGAGAQISLGCPVWSILKQDAYCTLGISGQGLVCRKSQQKQVVLFCMAGPIIKIQKQLPFVPQSYGKFQYLYISVSLLTGPFYRAYPPMAPELKSNFYETKITNRMSGAVCLQVLWGVTGVTIEFLSQKLYNMPNGSIEPGATKVNSTANFIVIGWNISNTNSSTVGKYLSKLANKIFNSCSVKFGA